MVNWSRWSFAMVGTGCMLLVGCASNTPTSEQARHGLPSSIALAREGAPAGAARRAAGAAGPLAAHSANPTTAPNKPSFQRPALGESFSQAVKSTTRKVADALDIKPRIQPAADAVKLSSMPDHLDPMLYIHAAAFSESQHHLAAARRQYEKALELDPDNVRALVAYARFRDRLGDFAGAVELYDRARAADPQSAVVWNDLGLCYARRGEHDQAIAAFERAVSLEPANPRYRNNLAGALVQADRPDRAVEELRAVYSEAIAHHNVGYFLHRIHRDDQAARYLKQAIELDPSLEAARTLLAEVDRPSRRAPGAAQPVSNPSDSRPVPQAARAQPHRSASRSVVPTVRGLGQPAPASALRRLPTVDLPRKAHLRRFPPPGTGARTRRI